MQTLTGNPWKIIRSLIAPYILPRREHPIPFSGGIVGYLSYDLGRYIEKLPSQAADDLPFPEGRSARHGDSIAPGQVQGRKI
ncbi:hypothetical protein [Neomoorella mulderi]|uniref:hypothetical protein n=1 Tax=Neomoorella mulderi TaxID=202604 RepID=UPI000782AF60|nr:hypothetical protein [Moorella mulderi]